MPITIPGVAGPVGASITATGNIGVGAPQLAAGITTGVVLWTPQIVVMTVDAGTAGVGSGGPIPVVIPGSIVGAMISGFAAFQLLGVQSQLLATGIANGLILAYAQGLIRTTHPGVGLGAGVATFRAPAAGPSMIAGFKSAGMLGSSLERMALAVGQALDVTFANLVIPVPIVGPTSPTGASGVGVGNII